MREPWTAVILEALPGNNQRHRQLPQCHPLPNAASQKLAERNDGSSLDSSGLRSQLKKLPTNHGLRISLDVQSRPGRTRQRPAICPTGNSRITSRNNTAVTGTFYTVWDNIVAPPHVVQQTVANPSALVGIRCIPPQSACVEKPQKNNDFSPSVFQDHRCRQSA